MDFRPAKVGTPIVAGMKHPNPRFVQMIRGLAYVVSLYHVSGGPLLYESVMRPDALSSKRIALGLMVGQSSSFGQLELFPPSGVMFR
jgi:hypothetical protein